MSAMHMDERIIVESPRSSSPILPAVRPNESCYGEPLRSSSKEHTDEMSSEDPLRRSSAVASKGHTDERSSDDPPTCSSISSSGVHMDESHRENPIY